MNAHVARLGLPPEVLRSFPHQLSGGMRQRVAIALATIFHPNLIIADEPTTALDVVVQRGVLQMLKQIQAESRNTVLLVTHDMAVHANVADRVMIMYAGRIMEEGVTETIFQAPRHPYTKHLIAIAAEDRRTLGSGVAAGQPTEPLRTTRRLSLPPALPGGHGRVPVGGPRDARTPRPPPGRLSRRRERGGPRRATARPDDCRSSAVDPNRAEELR